MSSLFDRLPDDAVLLLLWFCGSALDTKALANSVPAATRAASTQWLTAISLALPRQAAPTRIFANALCLEAGIRELEMLASCSRPDRGVGGVPGGRAFVALCSRSPTGRSSGSPLHCAMFGRDGELFCSFGDGSVLPVATISRRRKGIRTAARRTAGVRAAQEAGGKNQRRTGGAVQLPGGIRHLAVGESWVVCASGRHLHRFRRGEHGGVGEATAESTTIAAMVEAACDSPTFKTSTAATSTNDSRASPLRPRSGEFLRGTPLATVKGLRQALAVTRTEGSSGGLIRAISCCPPQEDQEDRQRPGKRGGNDKAAGKGDGGGGGGKEEEEEEEARRRRRVQRRRREEAASVLVEADGRHWLLLVNVSRLALVAAVFVGHAPIALKSRSSSSAASSSSFTQTASKKMQRGAGEWPSVGLCAATITVAEAADSDSNGHGEDRRSSSKRLEERGAGWTSRAMCILLASSADCLRLWLPPLGQHRLASVEAAAARGGAEPGALSVIVAPSNHHHHHHQQQQQHDYQHATRNVGTAGAGAGSGGADGQSSPSSPSSSSSHGRGVPQLSEALRGASQWRAATQCGIHLAVVTTSRKRRGGARADGNNDGATLTTMTRATITARTERAVRTVVVVSADGASDCLRWWELLPGDSERRGEADNDSTFAGDSTASLRCSFLGRTAPSCSDGASLVGLRGGVTALQSVEALGGAGAAIFVALHGGLGGGSASIWHAESRTLLRSVLCPALSAACAFSLQPRGAVMAAAGLPGPEEVAVCTL